ncbi:MAG: phosphoenolpyruvate carboxykinase (ATP), partial [bacterium]|nr:phosphoenolpyruvate carboxykinase (ATP) [bacterium]
MTTNKMGVASRYGLENQGIRNIKMAYWTLPTPALLENVVARREGSLAHEGSLVVRTGNHTGRAANDKFIVEGETRDEIWWG